MTYHETKSGVLYCGDVLATLRSLPDEIVNCCVTSPPYWGLRDYGTATWVGGDAECSHKTGRFEYSVSKMQAGNNGSAGHQARDKCPKCGAIRKDQQLGLEKTPEEHSDLVKKVILKASTTIDKLITNDDGNILDKIDLLGEIPSGSVVKNIEVSISFKSEISDKQKKGIKSFIKNMVDSRQLDKAHAKILIDDRLDEIDFFNNQLMVTEQVSLSGKYTDYQIIFDMLYKHLESKRELIREEYRQ